MVPGIACWIWRFNSGVGCEGRDVRSFLRYEAGCTCAVGGARMSTEDPGGFGTTWRYRLDQDQDIDDAYPTLAYWLRAGVEGLSVVLPITDLRSSQRARYTR